MQAPLRPLSSLFRTYFDSLHLHDPRYCILRNVKIWIKCRRLWAGKSWWTDVRCECQMLAQTVWWLHRLKLSTTHLSVLLNHYHQFCHRLFLLLVLLDSHTHPGDNDVMLQEEELWAHKWALLWHLLDPTPPHCHMNCPKFCRISFVPSWCSLLFLNWIWCSVVAILMIFLPIFSISLLIFTGREMNKGQPINTKSLI